MVSAGGRTPQCRQVSVFKSKRAQLRQLRSMNRSMSIRWMLGSRIIMVAFGECLSGVVIANYLVK